MTKQIL